MKKRTFKRNILINFSSILIPIILLLLFYNFYSIHVFNEKIAQSNYMSIAMYKNDMIKNLTSIENFMAECVGNDYRFQRLMTKEKDLESYCDSWEILESLKSNLTMEKVMAGYILISKPNNIEKTAFSGNVSYDTQLEIREKINYFIDNKDRNKLCNWQTIVTEHQSFLFRMIGLNDAFIVAIVDLEKCIPSVNTAQQNGNWFEFCTDENMPVLHKNIWDEKNITLTYMQEGIMYSGKPTHMVISDTIDKTDLSIKMIIPNTGFISNLDNVHIFLLIISILTVLIIPFSFWWTERYIANPLNKLIMTMEHIKNGNLHEKMEDDFGILEYRKLINSFNDMMEQVKNSKIEAYENEIERKHAQLQYLQLQIHPHFYLNCLKILYAMVECRDFPKFKEMIMTISNHIRYIFKDNMTLVPLHIELEHVKNYIRIQQLSTDYMINYHISIEPEFLDFLIPTLSIETFVENAFKYGGVGKEIFLMISAQGLLDDKILQIRIKDDGRGFPEEMLDSLNGKSENIYKEQYVGIENVKNRLFLLYGDNASIFFANNNGAEITIDYKM